MKKYRICLAVLLFVMALSVVTGALAYPSDTSQCPSPDKRHFYEQISQTPATCTQAGSITWMCQLCKKTIVETLPATGHAWGDWKVTAAAGCTAKGTEERICRRCQQKETRSIAALGHSWGAWKTAAAATCTKEGTEERICSRCKAKETRNTSALGHDWGAWKDTVAATCTDAGTQTRTCSRCKAKETRTVPALGHDWGPYMPDVPATCTDPGWENKTCKRDPSHLWYQEVPALGHDWGEWVRVKEPSYLGPGLEERACSRCGLTEQKEIPYDGPAFVPDPSLLLVITLTDPVKTLFAPNDTLTFDMTIVNTGNVPLERPSILICRDAALSDILNDGIKDVDVTFAPGESVSFTFAFMITDSDAPLLEVFWSASAWVAGTYETEGGEDGFVPGNTVKMEFPVEKDLHPELTLTFLGGSAAGLKQGDLVPYDVEVKNTGDTPITFDGYGVLPYPDDEDPDPEDFTNWLPHYTQVLAPEESFIVTHRTKISSNDAAVGKIERTAVAFGSYKDNGGYTQNVMSNEIDPEILLDVPPDDPPVKTEPTLVLSVTLADPADPFSTDLNGDSPPVTYDVTLIDIWDQDLEFSRITAHGETRTPAVGTLQGGIPVFTQIDGFVFNESEIIPGTGTGTLKGEVEITFIAYAVDTATGTEYASSPVTLRHGIKTDGFDDWIPPAETKVSLYKKVISDPILPQGYMLDETVKYEIQVTNESEVPLDITVYDPLSGTDPIAVLTAMAPNETRSVFFDYVVCGPDIDNKQIENQAHAEWMEPTGAKHSALSNKCVVLTAVPDDIYGIKAIVSDPANGKYYTPGETITCQITLYNPTALTYKDVELWDALFSAPDDPEPTAKWDKLEPYGSVTVHFDFVVSEEFAGYDFSNCAKFNATGNLDLYVTGITNTVTAKTGDEPPIRHYDGDFGPPVGDGLVSCVRTLTGKADGVFRCTLEYCSDHYPLERQVRALLSGAKTKADRTEAWQNAQALWRNALDKEYRILISAGTDGAPAAVNAMKQNDEACLNAYRALLEQLLPDDPEAVEQAVAEQLMNRVTDLCYMMHNAPKAPRDSLLNGSYAALDFSGNGPCGFRVLETSANKVTYEAGLCEVHAGIDSTVTELLTAESMAGARAAILLKAQRAWQTALDGKINAMYREASPEARSAIAAWRTALGRKLESDRNFLEILYPNDPLTVNEILANTMRDTLLNFCGF